MGCLVSRHTKCISIPSKEYSDLNVSAVWMCITCLFPGPDYLSYDEPETISFSNETAREDLRDAEIHNLGGFDVIALSETWLTSDILDCEVNIPGYAFIRKDRSLGKKSCGGGVIVYIKDGISYVQSNIQHDQNIEYIGIEITRNHSKLMLVSCIYRPGDQSMDKLLSELDQVLFKYHRGLILFGEFNVDYASTETPR